MNGGSLQKDHVRDHELHHRVIDFEREIAQCRVGAASRIPEIGKSGLRQCQLDFWSELLSVLFIGGYGTNCHLSLRRLFNPRNQSSGIPANHATSFCSFCLAEFNSNINRLCSAAAKYFTSSDTRCSSRFRRESLRCSITIATINMRQTTVSMIVAQSAFRITDMRRLLPKALRREFLQSAYGSLVAASSSRAKKGPRAWRRPHCGT